MGRKKADINIPSFDFFIVPVVKALKELGGSGTNEEINEKVFKITKLHESILNIPHKEEGSISEVEYRIAWAKTYLKKFGALENSSRGIWAIATKDLNVSSLDATSIVRAVRDSGKKEKEDNKSADFSNEIDEVEVEVRSKEDWKGELLNLLYQISPSAFERLSQRILRESGFVQVEVTGKSNDGGIDGKGIIRLSGLLSFHVIFQCKRYRGSVSPSQIRDFRGAMQGRADKGLFITTGTFSREAIKEATRDGAPPIDLVDGELLCEKLKELRLGVSTLMVEKVEVNPQWFVSI